MRNLRRIIAGVFLVFALTLAGCEQRPTGDDPNRALFEEAIEGIEDNFYKDISRDELYEAAIRGLFDALNDPFSRYMTEEEAKQFREGFGEEFVGVGVTVENIDDNVVVRKVWTDSPAEAAGMRPGDTVTHIDGVDFRHKSYLDTINALVGEEGTTVELGVRRPGVEETLTFTMERERIPNPSVTHDIFEVEGRAIGYLKINQFGDQTADLVANVLSEFEDENAIDGLVIDVRDNTGGYLTSVKEILDMFLTEGDLPMFTIEQVVAGTPLRHDYEASGTETKPYDIKVLVNQNSASASEVFAMAMMEKGGYDVIGTPSYGKGTMQIPVRLADNSQLHISAGRWFTPTGDWIHFDGGDMEHVQPTIEVEQNPYHYAYSVHLAEDEVLEYDLVSSKVANVQKILSAYGYDIRTDGYFDEATVLAVEDFQEENDLPVSGKVDGTTALALSEFLLYYRTDQATDTQLSVALDEFRE